MKKFTLLLFAVLLLLASFSCNKKESEQAFIKIGKSKIAVEHIGLQLQILVQANCQWTITGVPSWCVIEKSTVENKEYLNVQVLSNETTMAREATVSLTDGMVASTLSISQEGKKKETTLELYTFPVNAFSEVTSELTGNGEACKYGITSGQLFINEAIRNKIFHGNLIDCRMEGPLFLKDFRD